NLYVKMEDVAAKATLLLDGEFVALSRTIFDAQGLGKSRYDYVVTNVSETCKQQTPDIDGGWSIEESTEGSEAYSSCLSFIKDFESSN
ncbi:hypothetical protein OAL14_00005, partial [Gammaproteobacteria bacterium]|nr:hypothetical protein [Gammaproteobacteria bacterium]